MQKLFECVIMSMFSNSNKPVPFQGCKTYFRKSFGLKVLRVTFLKKKKNRFSIGHMDK